MEVVTAIKTAMFIKKHWKPILGGLFALAFGFILIPTVLFAAFSPGGEEEDVKNYIQTANELGIEWQDLIVFDMVKYDNKLKGRDPNDSAKYFISLRYEEFEPAKSKCIKKEGNECLEYKQVDEKITSSKEIKGYKEVSNFLGSDAPIKSIIDSINNSENKRVIVTALSAEEAMAEAGFSKKEKEEFYDLLESGVLKELYGDYDDFEMLPGGCINDVSPDGKAKVNAAVQAYTATIKKYAEEYGVGQYVEIIKAMMMAEGGGAGNDPMHASESAYGDLVSPACVGKEGGANIGCIKNPEDSIKAGVLTFRDTIKLANYDIAIALQSYNMGPNFANWIKDHGNKYSVEIAKQYQNEVMAKAGQGLGTAEHAQKILTRYYIQNGCSDANISPDMVGANNWIWPTKSKRITDTFYTMRANGMHEALDIGAIKPGVAGDPVWSMADGVVIQAGLITAGGRAVYIQHDNNVISRYIHLLSYNVKAGQKVTRGQIIGKMGGSGGTRTTVIDNDYPVHLDFQLKINGVLTDPLPFFPNIKK